jgi:hypothetical protein
MAKEYRKIWEQNYGKIPKDTKGRTYEIHHIDGNHNNNDITNLKCVTIEEHYKLHYENGDYGACVMIAKRMELPSDYISKIQIGIKRPGIGGVKKGTIPWNKGKKGYKLNLSVEGKFNRSQSSKKTSKIKEHDILNIVQNFKNKIEINNPEIGKIKGNGKILTYERAFCKEYGKIYNVTEQNIYRILKKYV